MIALFVFVVVEWVWTRLGDEVISFIGKPRRPAACMGCPLVYRMHEQTLHIRSAHSRMACFRSPGDRGRSYFSIHSPAKGCSHTAVLGRMLYELHRVNEFVTTPLCCFLGNTRLPSFRVAASYPRQLKGLPRRHVTCSVVTGPYRTQSTSRQLDEPV